MRRPDVKPYECEHQTAILMAVFNGEKYIDEQIQSLLEQTDQDWELFIHDDGSQDHTVQIIAGYAEKHPDQIHVITGEPTGNSRDNFLYLMQCVKAEYYMFCDQDDVWLKDKVLLTVRAMKNAERMHPDQPLLVFTDLSVVDENRKLISEKLSAYQNLKMDHTSFQDLMVCNVVTGCAMMINRKCRDLSLQCARREDMIMHDWWCALVASYFGKVIPVRKPLILYRQHGTNSVGAKNIHSGKYIQNALKHGQNQRDNILKTERQAGCFADTFHLQDPLIENYRDLDTYSKKKKLAVIHRYGLRKSGLVRTVGLWFYC